MAFDVDRLRSQFPALKRVVGGQPAVYFDGPAGTQVPRRVADAVREYLVNHNANCGGDFATSRETDAMLADARRAAADFLGSADPDCVVFGPNMTTLTFRLARSLANTWREGDEVIVTHAEHDANFTPWCLAARAAGATVIAIGVEAETGLIDQATLLNRLSKRTRLVALGCASNLTGTIQPFEPIVRAARDVGAVTFLDAVQFAPHRLIDVDQWGCDFLACSAYKFFGPHVGVLWGRRELLETLPVDKVRPAPDRTPTRWMPGTQNHEGIAGTAAAIDYLADVGASATASARQSRRDRLANAFLAIQEYERELAARLLNGLRQMSRVRIYGIESEDALHSRVPTVSIVCRHLPAASVAERLAAKGFFVWHGNFYALPLTTAWGLEPDGLVRNGLVHYNTAQEVDSFLAALADVLVAD